MSYDKIPKMPIASKYIYLETYFLLCSNMCFEKRKIKLPNYIKKWQKLNNDRHIPTTTTTTKSKIENDF